MSKKLQAEFTLTYAQNWWLGRYYGITAQEVSDRFSLSAKTGKWYELFPVTEAQYTAWYEWFIYETMRRWRISRDRAVRGTSYIRLDASPSVADNAIDIQLRWFVSRLKNDFFTRYEHTEEGESDASWYQVRRDLIAEIEKLPFNVDELTRDEKKERCPL